MIPRIPTAPWHHRLPPAPPWERRRPAGKRAARPANAPLPPSGTVRHFLLSLTASHWSLATGQSTTIPPANGPKANAPTAAPWHHRLPPAPSWERRRLAGKRAARPANAPLPPSGTVRHFLLSLTTSHWPLATGQSAATPPVSGPKARQRPTHSRPAPPPATRTPLGAPASRRQAGRKARQRTPTTARHHPHHSHPPAARPPQARSRVPPLNTSPTNDHQAPPTTRAPGTTTTPPANGPQARQHPTRSRQAPPPATRTPWERRRPAGKRPAGLSTPHPQPPGTAAHHTPPGTTTIPPANGPQARQRPTRRRPAPPPTTRAPGTTTTPLASGPQARQRPTRAPGSQAPPPAAAPRPAPRALRDGS